MSNLLNEKQALTKLRAELERRRGKLCWCCKGFRHLVQNFRNRKEEEKGKEIPYSKFEVLVSRVMKYGIELKRKETEKKKRRIVECFKYSKEGHQS